MKSIKWIVAFLLTIVIILCFLLYFPRLQVYSLKVQQEKPIVKNERNHTSFIKNIKENKKETIYHLALGDSVTEGYRSETNKGYVEYASDMLVKETGKGIIVDNLGIGGYRSEQLLEYIKESDVKEKIKNADIISINIGGNDVLKIAKTKGPTEAFQSFNTIKSHYEENLNDILSFIRKENKDTVLVVNDLYNPLPLDDSYYSIANQFLPQWNLVVYRTVENYQPSIVINVSSVLKSKDVSLWQKDNIHPNAAGYKEIAKQWIKQLKE